MTGRRKTDNFAAFMPLHIDQMPPMGQRLAIGNKEQADQFADRKDVKYGVDSYHERLKRLSNNETKKT